MKPQEKKKVVLEKRTLTYVSEHREFNYTGYSNDLIIDAMSSLYPGIPFKVFNQWNQQVFNSVTQSAK